MIETKELCFTYPADEGGQPVYALRGVDLQIRKGSFVVVLGHNGSGKSTLAKTFNAVLLPAGGKVYVEGMDTLEEELLLAIRQRVGMVFQNPDNQIVANVVEEDVAFAPENLGVPSEEYPPAGGRRVGGGGDERVRHTRATSALRRSEAAHRHRRRHRHGAGVHRAGRGHCHAGPGGPAGGADHHPPAQPGKGHHGGPDHPPYERGGRG